jgi:hypothetical protein
MFNKTPAPAIEPAPAVEVDPVDLIPLSVLALDLSAPVNGWSPFLTVRNIAIVSDDVGRDSITRADARTLIAEKRENEARAQEVARRQEQQAIEADRVRRASIWGGLPWHALPHGVSAAEAWAQAEKDAQPRRRSVLEDALSNEGSVIYSLGPESDES